MLEFALVSLLLLTLVFGIIAFGSLLSFKQDITRSAAEGARAGAVAYPASGAATAAQSATKDAVKASGKSCSTTDGVDSDGDGLSCKVSIAACTTSVGSCVTVELRYDQRHHPISGAVPFVSKLLPGTITSKSVARVNS
jgi:Flp pilus assembly protein TadG